MTFGGSPARNARLAASKRDFWRTSRTKRSQDCFQCVGRPCGDSTFVMWICAALLESAIAWRHVTRLLLVSGQTVWRRDVRDVAVPLGFARLWWKVRLRGAVPLGSAKQTLVLET